MLKTFARTQLLILDDWGLCILTQPQRIGLLKAEIERLEGAILSRQATREAAAAAFKG
jgi:uncharacterized small protein (DUF1192 family)